MNMTESPDADCHMIKVESKEAGKGAIFKVLEKQNTGEYDYIYMVNSQYE